jgi:hypothetical protein
MTNPGWKCRWGRIAVAGLLGAAIAAGATTGVRAADDDEDVAIDTKIFRQFMKGLGLRQDGAGIDYRERSPLVVPPALNLPAPEKGSITDKTAAWPVDPDVKREKEMRAARKKPRKTVEEESMPELPGQLGPRHATAPAHQKPTGEPVKDPTAPSPWSELGAKSIFTLGGLIGSKEEYAKFTGEPPRSSLIEPPPGYRTPSPAQPYGVGKPARAEALNPMDTPAMRGRE